MRAEKAPGVPFTRSITWDLSDRSRAGLLDAADRAVKDAAGLAAESSLQVRVLIREVPDASCGPTGRP